MASAMAKLRDFAEKEKKEAGAAAKEDLEERTASDKAALEDDSLAASSMLETADRSNAFASIPEFRAAMQRNEARFRSAMEQNLQQFSRAMDHPSLLQTSDRSGLQLKK